jgi:hypothetical protein
MPFGKDEKRVQASLLETRRVEEREIQAGTYLSRKDVAWPSDLLAGALEAPRRQDVSDRPRD